MGTFKLTIPGFSYNLLAVSCGDIGFIGLESRPQSAFVVFSKSNERGKSKYLLYLQIASPSAQMLGGVRLFDVRLTYLNDQLLLCHGKQPLPYVVGITASLKC